jgi:hypothetical protein
MLPSEWGLHDVVRERFPEAQRQPGYVNFCHFDGTRLERREEQRLRNLFPKAKISRCARNDREKAARNDAESGARNENLVIHFAFTLENRCTPAHAVVNTCT